MIDWDWGYSSIPLNVVGPFNGNLAPVYIYETHVNASIYNLFRKFGFKIWSCKGQLISEGNASGAVGGKTGKTSVLPGFSKIERGGGSGGVPQCYGGLTSPGGARHANGAAGSEPILLI